MDKASPAPNLKRPNENVKIHNESPSKKRRKDVDSNRKETASQNQRDSKKKVRLSTELFQDNCEISYSQIHELLRYAALGKCASAAQSSWCQIHNQKHLSGIVVILLRDVSQLHFHRFYLQFAFLRSTFRHRFSLPPPCSNIVSSLMGISQIVTADSRGKETCGKSAPSSVSALDENTPVTSSGVDQQINPIIQKYGNKKQGLTKYLLSAEEMKKQNFPFLGCPFCVNYVSTECSGPVTDSSPLFGLDCEMCLTAKGKELTRVSLVNADGRCIMDELVKPKNPILNYLTRFSGITSKILQPVRTRLQDIQARIKDLLPPDAVLVGHSLNNDIRALEMIHPNVIDTSLLYPRDCGGRYRLKFLAEAVLGQAIQCENKDGHDPAEDARAALELAQYMIAHGPRKVAELNLDLCLKQSVPINGMVQKATNIELHPPQDAAALKTTRNGMSKEPKILSSVSAADDPSLLEIMHLNGQQSVFLSGRAEAKGFPSSDFSKHFLCNSNKEVIHQAKEEIPVSAISIVQFSTDAGSVESTLMQQVHAKMRTQFAEMSMVYAGPFNDIFSLRYVKDVFEMCGPILSLLPVTGTQQPFVCIQYELLEAAQLAVEILDGACIEGSLIKVQRPINEATLDYDSIIRELDRDIETESIVYVSGIKKSETKEDLQLRFRRFKGLEHIFLPKDSASGKNRKYCFLKFNNYTSALVALTALNEPFDEDLKARKALSPKHFFDWTLHQQMTQQMTHNKEHSPEGNPEQEHFYSEQELRDKIKKLDKSVKRLCKTLRSNTLCLVLLPGINSSHGSYSGLGLMGVTAEEKSGSFR
ncbi:RNA exonuclease 5 isoform X2 [Lissotriton helveticus]